MNSLLRIAALSLALAATGAFAEVNEAVKNACRDDYHKHCDKLEVGSEELRACMKSKATELSKECLKALVENKEVTQQDIDEYYEKMQEKAKAQ